MVKVSLGGNTIIPNFDKRMRCHSTRIELFYFDDKFCRIAQWVSAFTTRFQSIQHPYPLSNPHLIPKACPFRRSHTLLSRHAFRFVQSHIYPLDATHYSLCISKVGLFLACSVHLVAFKVFPSQPLATLLMERLAVD